jgi:hypothetical protein
MITSAAVTAAQFIATISAAAMGSSLICIFCVSVDTRIPYSSVQSKIQEDSTYATPSDFHNNARIAVLESTIFIFTIIPPFNYVWCFYPAQNKLLLLPLICSHGNELCRGMSIMSSFFCRYPHAILQYSVEDTERCALRSAAAVKANHEPLRRGRPAKHTEDWSKITAVLFDRLSADIRANTRATVTRAEILRGLIAFLEESKIDITGATSEEALTETKNKETLSLLMAQRMGA